MISLSELFQGKEPTYAQLKSVKIEKITRATFLYMDPQAPKDEFAQCGTCVHWIEGQDLCELHRPRDHIDDDDSCCLYVHGKPAGGTPESLVTPQESGLVSRQVRCMNCIFFDPDTEPRKHCDLYTQLNRMMPAVFDLDRYVNEHGCCNAQTPGKRNPKVFGPIGPIPGPQDQESA